MFNLISIFVIFPKLYFLYGISHVLKVKYLNIIRNEKLRKVVQSYINILILKDKASEYHPHWNN